MTQDEKLELVRKMNLVDGIIDWRREFYAKRDEVVQDLEVKGEGDNLINSFSYANLKNRYQDFCPLYEKSKLCHPMEEKKLCCYFCACPHYLLDDSPYIENDLIYIGRCEISSQKRDYVKYKKITSLEHSVLILNCSHCHIPHQMKWSEKRMSDMANEL